MREKRTRKLAFAILSKFEELLAEHAVMIPSADREGEPDEACIYGSEYYLLEDEITDILVKGSRRVGELAQAREQAFNIIEEFEELLGRHCIKVPSHNPERAVSQVALCMPEWDRLRDGIVQLLLKNTVAVGQR